MSGRNKPFSLETDDRTDEERAQQRAKKKGWLFGKRKAAKMPMDTSYQEDLTDTTPTIRFNLNFDKKIRGCEEPPDRGEIKKFDITRLFAAVSSRDVNQLQGLHLYLHRSLKHLTNSEYKKHGKNALHKALLCLKDGENETIDFLLDIAEKMGDLKEFVNAAYTEDYYKGHSALHVAIERRSEKYVRLLVQKGADVHAKACGKFFQQHDGPCFYFGELPLSLAACTNQQSIVDFLISNPYEKVDITKVDSQGNTVLHALVVVADNSKESTEFVIRMYDHILITAAKLYPDIRLEDIENNRGLTPLKLAAKTGKIGLFKHMVQRRFDEVECFHLSRKFTEWAYGPVQSSLYDLTSVDSFDPHSVMEIIIYDSTIPNRLEMLQVEPLNKLLNDKWNKFAQWIFLINFLTYLTYISVFTTVAYNTKAKPEPFLEAPRKDPLYLTGHVISAAGAVYFFFKGIANLKTKRPNLQTLLVDGYSEILFFFQAVLFIISAVLHFCGKKEYLGFLVVCLALSWVNLLYFSRGSRHMGIYTVMIQKMIFSDVLRFLFVYIVYLLGFSAAVVTLLKDPPPPGKGRSFFVPPNASSGNEDCKKPTFKSLAFTTLELFKFTIGMGDLEFTENYQYAEVFYLLLITYIVFTYILLLNMLIALMNKTVEKLSGESLNIWRLQQAITILDLERSLPFCLRNRLRSGMEKELGRGCVKDRRWCFSVEEVNWTKWSCDMGIINEDPGHCTKTLLSPPSNKGNMYRLLHRTRAQPAEQHEMRPMMAC